MMVQVEDANIAQTSTSTEELENEHVANTATDDSATQKFDSQRHDSHLIANNVLDLCCRDLIQKVLIHQKSDEIKALFSNPNALQQSMVSFASPELLQNLWDKTRRQKSDICQQQVPQLCPHSSLLQATLTQPAVVQRIFGDSVKQLQHDVEQDSNRYSAKVATILTMYEQSPLGKPRLKRASNSKREDKGRAFPNTRHPRNYPHPYQRHPQLILPSHLSPSASGPRFNRVLPSQPGMHQAANSPPGIEGPLAGNYVMQSHPQAQGYSRPQYNDVSVLRPQRHQERNRPQEILPNTQAVIYPQPHTQYNLPHSHYATNPPTQVTFEAAQPGRHRHIPLPTDFMLGPSAQPRISMPEPHLVLGTFHGVVIRDAQGNVGISQYTFTSL